MDMNQKINVETYNTGIEDGAAGAGGAGGFNGDLGDDQNIENES
jgi:hypothetical protein